MLRLEENDPLHLLKSYSCGHWFHMGRESRRAIYQFLAEPGLEELPVHSLNLSVFLDFFFFPFLF